MLYAHCNHKMKKHCHFSQWRKANKIVLCLASTQNCLRLELQSDSHEMKSMAVNILTLYKFNGKFIWKINIKYLLYQVPSGSCIKHLSDSVGNCSEVSSVRLQPTFFRNSQLFMQGKHLFYLKNKEKTPPFLFLCVKIEAACCSCCSLILSTKMKSYFLEKGGECYFTDRQCIIDVEDLTSSSSCK